MANIKVLVADASHEKYVDTILDTIRTAAKKRGTGIAERTHEYVATKMKEGKAILAIDTDTQRCVNHDILMAKNRKFCICTGMLYDPESHTGEPTPSEVFQDVIKTLTLRGIQF